MIKSAFSIVFLTLFSLCSCSQQNTSPNNHSTKTKIEKNKPMNNLETATFGAGCFWCIEAIFQDLKGVSKVQSGYSNGQTLNPSYKDICTGKTGHAEVLKVEFDPSIISYEELLKVFWYSHNPTTLNRQGNDVGTQYRSGIYYHSEAQRLAAEQSKKATQATLVDPIVTEIVAAETFYPAEDYHNDYFNQHGTEPYCSMVVAPKVRKVKEKFAAKMK